MKKLDEVEFKEDVDIMLSLEQNSCSTRTKYSEESPLTNKKQREACLKAILTSNNFTAALQHKLALEKKGSTANGAIYYELIYRCDDEEAIMQLKEEMPHLDLSHKLLEKIYLCILKKVSEKHRYDILKEMQQKGIKSSLKFYDVMIRKSDTIEQALLYFGKMKKCRIKPDLRIYDELIRKARGTEYHTPIVEEQRTFQQFSQLLMDIRSFYDVKRTIKRAKEANIAYDIELYNDMILLVDSYADRVRLLDLIRLDELEYTHYTYWNFQKKSIDEETMNEATEILKKIENQLSTVERKMLIELYDNNASVVGGWGKITLQIRKLIYSIEQKISTLDDFKEQLYWTGFIEGADRVESELDDAIQEINEEIHLMETENDINLFELNIAFNQGQIEGIRRGQQILMDVRNKKIPILLVAYIENPEVLECMRLIALNKGFYQYGSQNINTYRLNGFIFSQSLTDFEKIINQVDYDMYEVAINVMNGRDYRGFVEEFGIELISKLDNLRENRFAQLNFLIAKDYLKKPEHLWESMLSGVALPAMSDLIAKKDDDVIS